MYSGDSKETPNDPIVVVLQTCINEGSGVDKDLMHSVPYRDARRVCHSWRTHYKCVLGYITHIKVFQHTLYAQEVDYADLKCHAGACEVY